jgi:hypothetical protein
MFELGERLRELAEADVVAFGGVGFAGEILPVTRAYDAVAEELARHGATLRPHLDWLLEHATPAGKVYAATLLDRVDPAAGLAAWRRLADDPAPVRTFVGCLMRQTTLAEYAGSR